MILIAAACLAVVDGEWMVRQGYAVPFVCRRVR